MDENEAEQGADGVEQEFDVKNRQTVRNLRIREDTAKYLRNLDSTSAYYDPKTRSMRENPYSHTGKDPKSLLYAGDNFERYSGDVKKVTELKEFSWEATTSPDNPDSSKFKISNPFSNPTQAAVIIEDLKKSAADKPNPVRDSLLSRYGGTEHLFAPVPKELLSGASSEQLINYSSTGEVLESNSQVSLPIRIRMVSRYIENKIYSNHSSVYGSFYDIESHTWGYSCCRSTGLINSYCGGKAAIDAKIFNQKVYSLLSSRN